MFNKDKARKEIQELTEQIAKLTAEVKTLSRQRQGLQNIEAIEAERDKLRRQINDLSIDKEKLEEGFDRERREIEHKIGLQKKKAEFDRDAGKREAIIAVREENLKSQQEEFDARMKFREKQFDSQVEYLQSIMEQILNRVPTITVDRQITEGSRSASRSK